MEIAKMLVACTSNISKATADLIEEDIECQLHDGTMPVVFRKGEYGWFVNVSDERAELYPDTPKDLAALIELAAKQGCQWVMLDRDADEVEGLEVFEW